MFKKYFKNMAIAFISTISTMAYNQFASAFTLATSSTNTLASGVIGGIVFWLNIMVFGTYYNIIHNIVTK